MEQSDLMERLAAMEERVDEAERRLDKQAKMIKGWRERVKALEQVSGNRATGSTDGGVQPERVEGEPPSVCLVCKVEKEAGREAMLTCRGCGADYQAQRRSGYAGEKKVYEVCLSCGAGKSQGPAFQCGRCSSRFRAWKASR